MNNKTDYFKNYLDKIEWKLSSSDNSDINHILKEVTTLNVYNNDFISIAENDLVIDIGLNFGIFTLDALQYKPKKIVAYEPNPKLANFFKKLNIDKVEVNQCAVSNKNGKITFYENHYPGRSSIHSDVNSNSVKTSYEVDVVNICDILNRFEFVDYLKIDCEGAEYEIIDAIDMEVLKNKIKKIVIEFHNVPTDIKVINLKNKIESAGFNFYIDYPGAGTTGMLYAKKLHELG